MFLCKISLKLYLAGKKKSNIETTLFFLFSNKQKKEVLHLQQEK